MEYPSKLVENAVEEIAKLPGIGKKTALRLAIHLLKTDQKATQELANSLVELRRDIKYCNTCHIIADASECTCRGMHTDSSLICVVEDTPDVIAIKNTGQYRGMFHVLGGRISPMNGLGPDELHIESLVDRIEQGQDEVKEVILALSSTMEGETTAFYIKRSYGIYKVI